MAYPASTPSNPLARPPQPAAPATSVPDTGTIRCLCEITDDDGETIFCEGCGFWQHMSCVGLANMPAEELPDKWYCWHCRPEKFEWIQRRPIPGSALATSTSRSSALSISNLLSPAPYSIPPPPQPKILLDSAKARKRQEQRRVEDERLKRHQREVAAATGASASGSGPSGPHPNGTNTAARTTAEPGGAGSAAHGRKPSVAAGDKPSKGRKQPTAVATAGGAVAGPTTSGASTSTPGAAASSSAGPSNLNTASSAAAAAAATSSKRKPSNASAALKRKDKDHPSKVAVPESSPRFNNSHGTQPFPTPLPTSTPRALTSGAFLPPKSPGRATHHLLVGVPGQARSRSRSLSVDVENRMAVDVEVGPNGPYLDVGHPNEIDDYFTGVGKGKGKEKEVFAVPLTPRDGLTTPHAVSTPFLPNGQQSVAVHTPRSAHPNYRSPPPPVYQPRPLHPLIASLGGGAKLGAPKGASTASSLSRPRPLVVRSFPAPPRTSGEDDDHNGRPGLALFLDPQPPPQPSSTRIQTSMLPPPTTPKSTILSTAASLLPPPDIDPPTTSSTGPISPSPQPHPHLTISIPDPSTTLSSFLPIPTASRTERRTPKPTIGFNRPNAVVRPLICGEHGHLSTYKSDRPALGRSNGVTFGVFALRDTVAGEPISLGWEMLETLNESSHVPDSPASTLSYIADTFVTCGSCGRKASDCVPDVLKKTQELSARQKEEEELQRSEIEVDVVGTPPGDGITKAPGSGKRSRSIAQTTSGDAMMVDESEEMDRPAKRPRLVTNDQPRSITADDPQAMAPAAKAASETAPESESLLGIDSTLRHLELEPGKPVLPDPRARFRASWKQQLERIQASQSAMLDNIQPAPAGSVPPIPALPAQASNRVGASALPGPSISSSPLTEPSDTGDDDSDQLSPTGHAPSRSPQRFVNGRTPGSGGGGSGRRVNKVRIESTPPSDDDVELSSPTLELKAPPMPAPPVKVLDLSQASDQKGPLRFRKWAIKSSEPQSPSVDIRMQTPAPQPPPPTQPFPTAHPPAEPSVDNDGDVDMGSSDPQLGKEQDVQPDQPFIDLVPTPAPRTPTPKPQPPPPPPVVAQTTSFSIRSLLNPAPDKPRSKSNADPPVVTAPVAVPILHQQESSKIPLPASQTLPTVASSAPSLPLSFRTSSPTLNLLLGGPRPTEQHNKPSPLSVEKAVADVAPTAPARPSPDVELQEPSVAAPPLVEAQPQESRWSYGQKVEEVETSLSKPEEHMTLPERQPSEAREPSAVPEVPELDLSDPEPETRESEEDSAMAPAEDVSVGIQSPLPAIPEEREDVQTRPKLAEIILGEPAMDVDPPSSSPLSEAPPELPVISVTMDAPSPANPTEPQDTEMDPNPDVPEPAGDVLAKESTEVAVDQEQPASSPVAPEPAALPTGPLLSPSLPISTADEVPHGLEASLSPAIHATPVSPALSSAAAMSPKPTRKKMSFADYAKQRKAKKEQQEKAKERSKETPEPSGSGALALVLEKQEPSASDETPANQSVGKDQVPSESKAIASAAVVPQVEPIPDTEPATESHPDHASAKTSPSQAQPILPSAPIVHNDSQIAYQNGSYVSGHETDPIPPASPPHSTVQLVQVRATSLRAPPTEGRPAEKAMDVDAAPPSAPSPTIEEPRQPEEAPLPAVTEVEQDTTQPGSTNVVSANEDSLPASHTQRMSIDRSSSPPESELVATPT
ncbi:hypothetical protein FRB90_004667, partial [Tulasnella sp. 427]